MAVSGVKYRNKTHCHALIDETLPYYPALSGKTESWWDFNVIYLLQLRKQSLVICTKEIKNSL